MLRPSSRRKGSVTLPFEGAFMLLTLYFPITFFVVGLIQYLNGPPDKAAGIGGGLIWTFVVSMLLSTVFLLPTIFVLLFTSIGTKVLEVESVKVGLGACQFWKGRNLKEKLSREGIRLLLLLTSMGLGALFAYFTLMSLPIQLIVLGWASATQIILIGLFLSVIAPLKARWPRMWGFEGDQEARYQHVW